MATNSEKFVAMLKDVAGDNPAVLEKFVNTARNEGITGLNSLSDDEYEAKVQEFASGALKNSIVTAVTNARNSGNEKAWKYVSEVAKRAGKYEKNSFNRDFSTLKKFYGEKPLLQLAGNDDEMNYQAALQGTSPDVLKKEISDAWEVQKMKNADKAEAERVKETEAARKKVNDEYNENLLVKVNKYNPFGRRVNEQVQRNILNGTEESVWDDAAIDLAQNVGELYLGGLAGAKLAGAVAKTALPKAAGAVADVFGNAGVDAVSNAVGQKVDVARGTQDKFNTGEALATFGASAGLSSGARQAIKFLSSTPGLTQIGRKLSKTFKKNDIDPTALEKEQMEAAIKKAQESEAYAKSNPKDVALQDRAMVDEQAAAKYADDPRVVRMNEEIDAKVEAEKAKPKPSKRKINNLEKKRVKYPGSLPTKKEYEAMTFEERAKIRQTYPNWFEEATDKPMTKGQKAGFVAAGLLLKSLERSGAHEPSVFADRKTKAQAETEKQADDIGVDPTTIRMWDAGFAPRGEGQDQDLYKKWKQRYRSGK